MKSNLATTQWQYLERHPSSWRQQLHIKGTRIKASVIYGDMIANQETLQETADNWDLPQAVIEEVREYCQAHQALLTTEAAEERRIVLEGVTIEPPNPH